MVSDGQKRVIVNAGLHAAVGFLAAVGVIAATVGQPDWKEAATLAVANAILGAVIIFLSDLKDNNIMTASPAPGAQPKKLLGI